MQKNIFILHVIILAAAAEFTACRMPFACTEAVEFSLPEWPPQDSCRSYYPDLLYWEVEIECGMEAQNLQIQPEQASVSFEMARNIPGAVYAYPIIKVQTPDYGAEEKAAKLFMPCGAVYPYRTDLTWQHGFTASILAKFYRQAAASEIHAEEAVSYAAHFNWPKFISAVEQKCTDKTGTFYNPWNAAPDTVLEAICSRSFKVSYLAQKNCHSITMAELLEEAGGDGILISSYIPQNGAEEIAVQEEKYSTFIYAVPPQEYKFAYGTVLKDGSISLAINSIPIYTKNK